MAQLEHIEAIEKRLIQGAGEMTPYDFQEYLKATEPSVREKAYAWKTAIGLQQVDGLVSAHYLAVAEG